MRDVRGGNVYLIELFDDNERFYKIGISVHKYCRFYEIMKHGYSCNIVYMVLGIDYIKALGVERRMQEMFASYVPKKRFGGYTECFKGINVELYKETIKNIIGERFLYIQNTPISWR